MSDSFKRVYYFGRSMNEGAGSQRDMLGTKALLPPHLILGTSKLPVPEINDKLKPQAHRSAVVKTLKDRANERHLHIGAWKPIEHKHVFEAKQEFSRCVDVLEALKAL